MFGHVIGFDGADSVAVPANSLSLDGARIQGGTIGMDAELAHATVRRNCRAARSATARFLEVPRGHDGSTPFTLGLEFSHEPDTSSYVTVRGSLLEVSGATIAGAKRATAPSKQAWFVTVRPGTAATSRSRCPCAPAPMTQRSASAGSR